MGEAVSPNVAGPPSGCYAPGRTGDFPCASPARLAAPSTISTSAESPPGASTSDARSARAPSRSGRRTAAPRPCRSPAETAQPRKVAAADAPLACWGDRALRGAAAAPFAEPPPASTPLHRRRPPRRARSPGLRLLRHAERTRRGGPAAPVAAAGPSWRADARRLRAAWPPVLRRGGAGDPSAPAGLAAMTRCPVLSIPPSASCRSPRIPSRPSPPRRLTIPSQPSPPRPRPRGRTRGAVAEAEPIESDPGEAVSPASVRSGAGSDRPGVVHRGWLRPRLRRRPRDAFRRGSRRSQPPRRARPPLTRCAGVRAKSSAPSKRRWWWRCSARASSSAMRTSRPTAGRASWPSAPSVPSRTRCAASWVGRRPLPRLREGRQPPSDRAPLARGAGPDGGGWAAHAAPPLAARDRRAAGRARPRSRRGGRPHALRCLLPPGAARANRRASARREARRRRPPAPRRGRLPRHQGGARARRGALQADSFDREAKALYTTASSLLAKRFGGAGDAEARAPRLPLRARCQGR